MPAVCDKTKCQKNYACIGVCPVGAISKDKEGFPKVETLDFKPNRCIECGACEGSCPTGAMRVKPAGSEEPAAGDSMRGESGAAGAEA